MSFTVNKRDNNRLNEVQKILKPVDFVPNSYGDRFIPRRYALTRWTVGRWIQADHKPECDPLETDEFPRNLRSPLYTSALKEALALVSARNTMLSFSDAAARDICRRWSAGNCRALEWVTQPTYCNPEQLDWSCKPRQKPTSFIEAIHDLPLIKTGCQKIIDWSQRDQIAAVFNKKLVIWSPHTDETMGLRAQGTTAIAFSPSGDRLVLADYMAHGPGLLILDMQRKPFGQKGVYKILEPFREVVTYVVWDDTGNYVLCGMYDGLILSVCLLYSEDRDKDGQFPCFTNHMASIRAMKFSCGFKYLATSDYVGCVYVWAWKAGLLDPLMRMMVSPSVVLFDWHPWREDEIAIADSDPISVGLYHIPSGKIVSSYRSLRFEGVVTEISFNKISAELVVCLGFIDTPKPPVILVLASMDRVVDVLHNHDDMIFHLLWSPDGMQLASAGLDETLCIWNFFGITSSKKCKRRKRQYESTIGSVSTWQSSDAVGTKSSDRGPTRSKRNKEATYRALASSFPFKAMR
ncbi:protein cortex [Anopheles aquasalis]|uniref:protein cortex n=1 Tax=Anopheles aquasalis TaxID=42839 RepID=UPI00215A92C5|nr:protein cortex [Anopheles aquasalis]